MGLLARISYLPTMKNLEISRYLQTNNTYNKKNMEIWTANKSSDLIRSDTWSKWGIKLTDFYTTIDDDATEVSAIYSDF